MLESLAVHSDFLRAREAVLPDAQRDCGGAFHEAGFSIASRNICETLSQRFCHAFGDAPGVAMPRANRAEEHNHPRLGRRKTRLIIGSSLRPCRNPSVAHAGGSFALGKEFAWRHFACSNRAFASSRRAYRSKREIIYDRRFATSFPRLLIFARRGYAAFSSAAASPISSIRLELIRLRRCPAARASHKARWWLSRSIS
jgi:hypothetical protein